MATRRLNPPLTFAKRLEQALSFARRNGHTLSPIRQAEIELALKIKLRKAMDRKERITEAVAVDSPEIIEIDEEQVEDGDPIYNDDGDEVISQPIELATKGQKEIAFNFNPNANHPPLSLQIDIKPLGQGYIIVLNDHKDRIAFLVDKSSVIL